MSSTSFNNLTFSEKGSQLFRRTDNFLCQIDYYNQTVALYKHYNFFVEVFYNKQSNEINEIKACLDEDLTKFVSRVELSL